MNKSSYNPLKIHNIIKNKSARIRIIYLILLTVTIALFVRMFIMNYSGYCTSAGKVFTNEERVRFTVEHILKNYPPHVIKIDIHNGFSIIKKPVDPIYYSGIEEFFSINPNCCAITETRYAEEGAPNFMNRAMGTVYGFARINYKVRYFNEDRSLKVVLSENHIPISNCGRPTSYDPARKSIFESFFGFDFKNLDYFKE